MQLSCPDTGSIWSICVMQQTSHIEGSAIIAISA